ncbi:MAG: thioredoxin family protein [Chitinophagales bacterium]
MKNFHFTLVLLTSILIATGIHYIEYQSTLPKLQKCFSQHTPCFKDYDEGLRAAKLWEKPAILMFSAWACVNCQRWVEVLYKHPPILKFMEEEFVLIVLEVDDMTSLPSEEQITYFNHQGKQKELKTVGDKWTRIAISCYTCCSQPKFFLINSEKELLVIEALGYANLEKFQAFLEAGLHNFQHGISEGKMECDL